MKIFSAQQIYEADKFTIKKQEISSDALMERAAVQLFEWLHKRMQGAPVKIHIFCGIGNNGGDGIALARHLWEHGYNMEVNVVNYSDKRSKDFLLNLNRLKDRKIWPNFINKESAFPVIHPDDIIVDAIFGIGLNRPPDPWVATLIQNLNNTGAFILSVDVASGLNVDKKTENTDGVIRANFVLSFQAPKLVFFLPETGVFCDQWDILDIGLDQEYLQGAKTAFEYITKQEVLPLYRSREKFAHKGTYGHALILGGSYGKIGAVILATRAGLRIGSGLVTAFVPKCGYVPLQTAIPEAMVLSDKEETLISDIAIDISPNVIGLGIGMGTDKITIQALANFLATNKTPLVIDADGLNILAKKKALLKALPKHTILTPHPKELERLVGKWTDDFDKLKKVKAFAKKYKCIVVIKGAHTITVFENRGYINATGNPGMATAGSGDALTGVITGLVAQGYEPLHAAVFGVYLHGRAADIAVNDMGYQALTAQTIVDYIGKAYLDLFELPPAPQAQAETSKNSEE